MSKFKLSIPVILIPLFSIIIATSEPAYALSGICSGIADFNAGSPTNSDGAHTLTFSTITDSWWVTGCEGGAPGYTKRVWVDMNDKVITARIMSLLSSGRRVSVYITDSAGTNGNQAHQDTWACKVISAWDGGAL